MEDRDVALEIKRTMIVRGYGGIMKRQTWYFLLIILAAGLLVGCRKEEKTEVISRYISSIDSIEMEKDVKIAGLGEATHGNSELQTLKLEVFKALVKNNQCRVFALEGDFGGCGRVNEYIRGERSLSSAAEAAAEIGFAIYRTEEMADLIQWMHDYNIGAEVSDRLSFYGFDMQRYDNGKELLFAYLEKADKALGEEYKADLADLEDETDTQEKDKVKKALTAINSLMEKMISNREAYIGSTDEEEYDFALQCARSIKENATLQSAGNNYSNLRDEYMKNKVDWILEREGGSLIFITGHNGHIEKTSASLGYTCMGQRLANDYGKAYFAIGTDVLETSFNAVTKSGKEKVITVKHKNALTKQFAGLSSNINYLEFAKAEENSQFASILNRRLAMVNIGAEFDSWQKVSSFFYTLKIVPDRGFDGLIVLQKATPSQKAK